MNHPSFTNTKELINSGLIREIISIETEAPMAQKQNWSYFVDSAPDWVVGAGDQPPRESSSNEFTGQGMMVTVVDLFVHFRNGACPIHVAGTAGELLLRRGHPGGCCFRQDIDTPTGRQPVEMPWPEPQLVGGYNAVYGLENLIDCLDGSITEPKNSGRRVGVALEVEIALKQSAM